MCGANVSCKGGCSVAVTAPKCEGQLTAPKCDIDANCEASCQGHAEINASCSPPVTTFECTAGASADVTSLATTLKAHLPALLEIVSTQGPLLVQAGANLVTAGGAIAGNVATLSGKAFACAGVAASAAVTASASINVSVTASVSVSGSCGGPTS
jgi:hypothetical protein